MIWAAFKAMFCCQERCPILAVQHHRDQVLVAVFTSPVPWSPKWSEVKVQLPVVETVRREQTDTRFGTPKGYATKTVSKAKTEVAEARPKEQLQDVTSSESTFGSNSEVCYHSPVGFGHFWTLIKLPWLGRVCYAWLGLRFPFCLAHVAPPAGSVSEVAGYCFMFHSSCFIQTNIHLEITIENSNIFELMKNVK